MGKVNYATRLGKQGIQGEIEAYPKINKNVYLDVAFAFGDEPNLFPNQTYGLEAYVVMDKSFDFSAGGKYNRVDSHHQFAMYTGSIARNFNNNRLIFRPYYFVPGVGKSSILYTVDLRHTIVDPYYYIGCIAGAGKSPDLANLTTVNFLVVEDKLINPYINIPFNHDRLLVNFGLLYLDQRFPNGLLRNWVGGTINVTWRY